MRNEDMRPTPPEMDFTIDDILDEFGSGGSRRDPEPEPAPEPEPIPEPEPVPEPEVAVIVTTSGSTGYPKGVLLSVSAITSAAAA